MSPESQTQHRKSQVKEINKKHNPKRKTDQYEDLSNMSPESQTQHRRSQVKEINKKRKKLPENRERTDLSHMTSSQKKEHRKKINKEWREKNKYKLNDKKFRKRLSEFDQKKDTHLLVSGVYISRSECFHQYDDYDEETDYKRIYEMFPDETEASYLQKVNEFAQIVDIGGYRENQKGEPSVQKIHKDMDGDYYICPYCNSYKLPGEVEITSGYRWDCCKNGTLRALIELEKSRPESLLAKYFFQVVKKEHCFEITVTESILSWLCRVKWSDL